MLEISHNDLQVRTEQDNPWWGDDETPSIPREAELPRRTYFQAFYNMAISAEVRRASILIGPRRVGKTVMMKQAISKLIKSGLDGKSILYASIDAPIFANYPLERFLNHFPNPPKPSGLGKYFVFFDEIQYLKDWQIHLKDLVDRYPNIRFIASGSAAASLKRAFKESGAGRFSDFLLPPLTFAEYINFVNKSHLVETANWEDEDGNTRIRFKTPDITELYNEFLNYLNFLEGTPKQY